jgi:hypothetical protein
MLLLKLYMLELLWLCSYAQNRRGLTDRRRIDLSPHLRQLCSQNAIIQPPNIESNRLVIAALVAAVLEYPCADEFTLLTPNQRAVQLLVGTTFHSTYSLPVSILKILDVHPFEPFIEAIPNRNHNRWPRSPMFGSFDLDGDQRASLFRDIGVRNFMGKHNISPHYWPLAVQVDWSLLMLINLNLWSSVGIDIHRRYERPIFDEQLPLSRGALKKVKTTYQERLASTSYSSDLTLNADMYVGAADAMRDLLNTSESSCHLHISCSQTKLKRWIEWLDDCAASLQGIGHCETEYASQFACRGGKRFKGIGLVMVVLFAGGVKDASSINELVAQALRILFSPGFAEVMMKSLSQCPLPSGSTVSRARLWLDCAFILYRRMESVDFGLMLNAIYLKLDASPQAGRDWLMIKCREVKVSVLNILLGIVFDLISEPLANNASVMDIRAWSAKCAQVAQAFSSHTFVPVALGMRRASLRHKLAAMLWCVYIESVGLREIIGFLTSVIAITTDQGTEAGLADVPSIPLAQLLPQMKGEFDIEDDDGEIPIVNCNSDPSQQFCFEFALTLPGILHIMHNLTSRILSNLTLWDWFLPLLKAVTKFLSRSYCIERFKAILIPEKLHDTFAWMLDRSFDKVLEWRWGTVFKVLTDIKLVEKVMRRFWDKNRFLHGADEKDLVGKDVDEDRKLDFGIFDTAVGSKVFWMYCTMLLQLQDLVAKFSSWCEGCPCHMNYITKKKSHDCHFHHAEIKKAIKDCPLGGCLGPNMVAGDFQTHCDAVANMSSTDIMLSCSIVNLSSADEASVTDDFSKGVSFILLELKLKLNFWNELPYIIFGLAHFNEDVARSIAVLALALWVGSALPREAHHRLTIVFFAEGALRSELDAFIAGGTRNALPILWLALAKLFFVSITERDIEAVHAMLKQGVAGKGAFKDAVVSLASGRFLEIKRLVNNPKQGQSFLTKMAGFIDVARDLKALSVELCISTHRLFDISGITVRTFRNVLYRADAQTQYANLKEAEAEVDKSTKRRDKVKKQVQKLTYTPRTSYNATTNIAEAVTKRLAWEHWRTLSDTNHFYSLPLEAFVSSVRKADKSANFVESLGERLGIAPAIIAVHATQSSQTLGGGEDDWEDDGEKLFMVPSSISEPSLNFSIYSHSTEPEIDRQVVFRVVSTTPSSLKCVHGTLVRPIGVGDVAITVHRVLGRTPDGGLAISSCPGSLSAAASLTAENSLQILRTRDALSVPTLVNDFRDWSRSDNISLSAPALALADAERQALHALVVAKAWPGFIRAEFMVDGPRHVLQVPADDARMLNSLRTLRMRHGLVECERELDNGNTCWYLTFLASKTLRAEYALPLQDSQLAIRCREVPEDEKTEFELLKSLQDAGWDLQRHTSKALPLPYVDGSNKDLFIGKSAMLPSWNYLRALCNASTIFSLGACNSIAHLQREDYYNDLMAGKRPAVVDSILDDDGDDLRPARRRRAPLGPRPRTKAAPIADANSDAADDCNDDDDGDDSDSDHSIVEALHEALDGDPEPDVGVECGNVDVGDVDVAVECGNSEPDKSDEPAKKKASASSRSTSSSSSSSSDSDDDDGDAGDGEDGGDDDHDGGDGDGGDDPPATDAPAGPDDPPAPDPPAGPITSAIAALVEKLSEPAAKRAKRSERRWRWGSFWLAEVHSKKNGFVGYGATCRKHCDPGDGPKHICKKQITFGAGKTAISPADCIARVKMWLLLGKSLKDDCPRPRTMHVKMNMRLEPVWEATEIEFLKPESPANSDDDDDGEPDLDPDQDGDGQM